MKAGEAEARLQAAEQQAGIDVAIFCHVQGLACEGRSLQLMSFAGKMCAFGRQAWVYMAHLTYHDPFYRKGLGCLTCGFKHPSPA